MAVLLLSAAVLGLAAYLGSLFLPNIQRQFIIHSICLRLPSAHGSFPASRRLWDFQHHSPIPHHSNIPNNVRLVSCAPWRSCSRSPDFRINWSQPRVDGVILFVIGVLWLGLSSVSFFWSITDFQTSYGSLVNVSSYFTLFMSVD